MGRQKNDQGKNPSSQEKASSDSRKATSSSDRSEVGKAGGRTRKAELGHEGYVELDRKDGEALKEEGKSQGRDTGSSSRSNPRNR